MPSLVTDRPNPEEGTSSSVVPSVLNDSNIGAEIEIETGIDEINEAFGNPASTSTPLNSNDDRSRSQSLENLNATLETIRPFPKAGARKQNRRGRKRRRSAILTSKDMMNELAAEQAKSKQKRTSGTKVAAKRGRPKKIAPSTSTKKTSGGNKGNKKGKRKEQSSDDDNSDDYCCVCFEDMPYVPNNRKCNKCKSFAHEKCAQMVPFFTCNNCISDDIDE